MATIRDVAAQARVSIKTVSRVINNVTTVKPHTRERVLRVIRKLDYHPSPSARGLSGSRSYLISLLYDVSCAYYATGVLGGVLETCRASHYQVVMQPCDYKSPTLAEEVTRNLRQSHADGVIVTPPLSDMKMLKALLEEQNIPFVRIAPAEHADDRRSVYTDDRESCAKMTEQLAGLGHVRIGFIIGNPDHAAVAHRFQGYRDGLRKCGLGLDRKLVAQGYNSYDSGVECARKLLQAPASKRPTAIFASNDEMAAGVYRVANKLGLSIPGDISIVGFDDGPLAARLLPSMTTIRLPIRELGRLAANKILHPQAAGGTHAMVTPLEPHLVIRDSCQPPTR
jgi:LacI family transcriptional regulator